MIWSSSRNGQQNCPTSHSVLADVSWIHLHWSRWTPQEAVGTGIEAHYETPTRIESRLPITIHLSNLRTCKNQQPTLRIYGYINVSFKTQGGLHQTGWSYSCQGSHPNTGEGAGGG